MRRRAAGQRNRGVAEHLHDEIVRRVFEQIAVAQRAQRFAQAPGVTAARFAARAGTGGPRAAAGSVTREGAALGEGGAARSRGAMPARLGHANTHAAGRRPLQRQGG